MAGVQKRTVFMVVEHDHTISGNAQVMDFHDWATCATSVGSCMEPFMPNMRLGIGTAQTLAQYDNRDQIAMINKIQEVDKGQLNALFVDVDGAQVHSVSSQVFRLRP